MDSSAVEQKILSDNLQSINIIQYFTNHEYGSLTIYPENKNGISNDSDNPKKKIAVSDAVLGWKEKMFIGNSLLECLKKALEDYRTECKRIEEGS